MKYPSGWQEQDMLPNSLGSTLDILRFDSPETQRASPLLPQTSQVFISIRIFEKNSKDIDKEFNYNRLGAQMFDKLAQINESVALVANQDVRQLRTFYKSEGKSWLNILNFLEYDRYLFEIDMTAFGSYTNETNLSETENIYSNFLSTFKFIEPTSGSSILDITVCMNEWKKQFVNFDMTTAEGFEKVYSHGALSIVFKEGISEARAREFAEAKGLFISPPIAIKGFVYHINAFYVPIGEELQWACRLRHDPLVKYAEPLLLPIPPPALP
ncbi:MAG: hypothetical protein QMD50_01055 [Patescibacteria group bacterium]|nr:hypothetical protein [Patescibacteria group bacterium]